MTCNELESDSEVEQESWWGEDAIEDVVRDKISDDGDVSTFFDQVDILYC